jgi:hypothetical protein
VMEAATGKQVSALEFRDSVKSVAFSSDGRWFAAGSDDNTARVIDSNWWKINYNEGIEYGELLSSMSVVEFDDVGKLSLNPQMRSLSVTGKDFFRTPIAPTLQPLAIWLTDLPEERMSSPWSKKPLRNYIGERLIDTISSGVIRSSADQAPWHPLVPVSLAWLEEDSVQDFLAGLTLKRLRDADPELWGKETLALYFAKSAERMDEIGLVQVALDTAEEALKRNPGDEGVLRILENVKERMEKVPSDQ